MLIVRRQPLGCLAVAVASIHSVSMTMSTVNAFSAASVNRLSYRRHEVVYQWAVSDGPTTRDGHAVAYVSLSTSSPNGLSFSRTVLRQMMRRPRTMTVMRTTRDGAQVSDASSNRRQSRSNGQRNLTLDNALACIKLVACSIVAAILMVAWEQTTMAHPVRMQLATTFGSSTVRGMGVGRAERSLLWDDSSTDNLRSYNEVMQQYRQRQQLYADQLYSSAADGENASSIQEDTVRNAVETIQHSLLLLLDMKELVQNYEWDELRRRIRDPLLQSRLEESCTVLKSAKSYLTFEARQEIGFAWGSCAWRHCGAFADAQEAIDELDYTSGMLEPFECMFVIDVIERSLREILDVSAAYRNDSVQIPEYAPLVRMSDMAEGGESEFTNDEVDYLNALSQLRSIDDEDSAEDGDIGTVVDALAVEYDNAGKVTDLF